MTDHDNSTILSFDESNDDVTTTISSETANMGKRRKKRDTIANEFTPAQSISFSMLQVNPKVNSDMNFLLSEALRSGNQTLINWYQNAFENITEFIEV
jgi:hypothetical protein